jgi:hypothetical protein
MTDAERQLALEGAQRKRVAILAILAGLAYFGGELWSSVIEAKDPAVGLLQGLAPALGGKKAANVDPRTVHEQFLVHHQVTLIISLVLIGAGAALMIFPLRYLAAAERLRSTTPSGVTSYLARYAPLLIAIFFPVYEISLIVGAHNYLSGSARTSHAITAATGGGLRTALFLLLTLGTLSMAATFVLISLRSMRVGLLTRMMGGVGIIGGVLFVIPLTPLPVVQALWLIFFAAMLLEWGARPLPEAWTVPDARPWPSPPPRQPRQPRGQRGGQQRPARAGRASSAPPAPEPVVRGASTSASKKRKRRR